MKRHAQEKKPGSQRFTEYILEWLKYGNIYLVSGAPLLLGFLLLTTALSSMDLTGQPPQIPVGPRLLSALSLVIAGFGGVFQVWRREVPGPLGGSTQGVIAVVLGWIWILIFWGAAVGSLFLGGLPAP